LDRQIKRTGPSLILTEAMLRRPRRRADTSNDHQEYLGEKRRGLTRTRQKLRHRYTLTPACSLPSDYSRESVRSNSREQGSTDSGKRLRFFDNYVMSPMQTLVSDRMRTETERDAKGVADARKMLDVAYGWLEEQLTPQAWASGSTFSLADCSAAPALFYADWVHPVGDQFPGVLAYRGRVLARPSVARVVDEARPFRKLFPQGAPDRD